MAKGTVATEESVAVRPENGGVGGGRASDDRGVSGQCVTTVESVAMRPVAVGLVTNVESVAARGGGCGVDGSTASDDRGVGGRRPNRTNTVAVGPLTTVESVGPVATK